MEITQLLELVNNPEFMKGIAEKLSDAIPIQEMLVRGSNPFIPDQGKSDLPVIRVF